MKIRVMNSEFLVHNIHTRMPFRYGIATLTVVPQLVVRLFVKINGEIYTGLSADNLPPKWFTKNPNQSYEEEIKEMIDVIYSAGNFSRQAGECSSIFDLWKEIYTRQSRWGDERKYPPLLWNFGVSLIERAVIDAFCKATGQTLADAIRKNTLGMDFGALRSELAGMKPKDFLPGTSSDKLSVRHTVGLTDPLTDQDIPDDERVTDSLPQSLEASIKRYGLRYFKIKLCGNEESDLERLQRIAGILKYQGISEYRFTIDGNEQYTNIDSLKSFWQRLNTDSDYTDFVSRLIVIEQPFHRDIAFNKEIADGLMEWRDHPPIIIDESDATLNSLPRAIQAGYAGVSHKNCKGICKSLYNAALIEYYKRQNPGSDFVITAEDLAIVGPVSLNQDLAMVSVLGINHVERNGHHYFFGLSFFNKNLQQQTLKAHGDLFKEDSGTVVLKINNGDIKIRSVMEAPFGYNFDPDLSDFIPLTEWKFESLNV